MKKILFISVLFFAACAVRPLQKKQIVFSNHAVTEWQKYLDSINIKLNQKLAAQ